MEEQTMAAQDNLLAAKLHQAHNTNKDQRPEPVFTVGDKVLLTTGHHQQEYMQAKDGRVAKFMPCFDGPYEVLQASSTYRL